MDIGSKYYAPDGYFPNGDSRPWRLVTVVRLSGPYVEFTYDDDGERGFGPIVSLKEKEED